MIPAAFDYFAPTSLAEACTLLEQHGSQARLLAGGHSLLPMMKLRLAQPQILIDLGKIPDLSYVREDNGGLAIGAMTTYYELTTSDLVRRSAPVLAEAAAEVADIQVRNRGTIGGSLAHADPGGDLPGVTLALGAELVVTSASRERTISIDNFFVDLLTTALQPGEVLTEIRIPTLPVGSGTAYAKFANKASHYAIVGVAAVVTVDSAGQCQQARVAVTGAGPKAFRATETEAALREQRLDDGVIRQAAQRAGSGIDMLEDLHASSEYRQHLVTVFTEKAIRAALSRATG